MGDSERERRIILSAPGKLMLAGEYVVLDGATALVAAVDARVVATVFPGAPSDTGLISAGTDNHSGVSDGRSAEGRGLGPEALLAKQYAESAFGETQMQIQLDTTALRRGARKFGLGSSAGASAVSAAAVMAWHGRDPEKDRHQVFELALAGHTAIAPQGSGADVAAATLGGILAFERETPSAARSMQVPEGLSYVVVWTGQPARTSDLLLPVRGLLARDESAYRKVSVPLADAADSFISAWQRSDVSTLIEASRAHHRAMAALGEASGAKIVTPALERVSELAIEYGGGAKPSGAGGGDVALAFFESPEQAKAFKAACTLEKLDLLDLRLGAEGVRIDDDSQKR